jgi:hypothetical protein
MLERLQIENLQLKRKIAQLEQTIENFKSFPNYSDDLDDSILHNNSTHHLSLSQIDLSQTIQETSVSEEVADENVTGFQIINRWDEPYDNYCNEGLEKPSSKWSLGKQGKRNSITKFNEVSRDDQPQEKKLKLDANIEVDSNIDVDTESKRGRRVSSIPMKSRRTSVLETKVLPHQLACTTRVSNIILENDENKENLINTNVLVQNEVAPKQAIVRSSRRKSMMEVTNMLNSLQSFDLNQTQIDVNKIDTATKTQQPISRRMSTRRQSLAM